MLVTIYWFRMWVTCAKIYFVWPMTCWAILEPISLTRPSKMLTTGQTWGVIWRHLTSLHAHSVNVTNHWLHILLACYILCRSQINGATVLPWILLDPSQLTKGMIAYWQWLTGLEQISILSPLIVTLALRNLRLFSSTIGTVKMAYRYILSLTVTSFSFQNFSTHWINLLEWNWRCPVCKVGTIKIQLPFWAPSCNSYSSFLNNFLPNLPP